MPNHTFCTESIQMKMTVMRRTLKLTKVVISHGCDFLIYLFASPRIIRKDTFTN